MEQEKLNAIRAVLERGWSAETSFGANPAGTKEAKSYGQCYITARTLSYVFGWELLILKNPDYNHYWNKLPDGTEIDFTSDQMGGDGFKPIPEILGKGKPRKFKPIDNCKYLNPRLKKYMNIVKDELVKLRE